MSGKQNTTSVKTKKSAVRITPKAGANHKQKKQPNLATRTDLRKMTSGLSSVVNILDLMAEQLGSFSLLFKELMADVIMIKNDIAARKIYEREIERQKSIADTAKKELEEWKLAAKSDLRRWPKTPADDLLCYLYKINVRLGYIKFDGNSPSRKCWDCGADIRVEDHKAECVLIKIEKRLDKIGLANGMHPSEIDI